MPCAARSALSAARVSRIDSGGVCWRPAIASALVSDTTAQRTGGQRGSGAFWVFARVRSLTHRFALKVGCAAARRPAVLGIVETSRDPLGFPVTAVVSLRSSSEAELVRLRDGSVVVVRAVGEEDEAQLRVFLMGLCADSRRLRFFTGAADLDCAAHWAAGVAAGRYGLLAHDAAGVLVAHAVYVQLEPTRAEVAVEVADRLHACGLGTILLERLASAAALHGIRQFVAEVLSENRPMLDVFRDGFDARVVLRGGIEMVEFPTAAWRLARQRFESTREQETKVLRSAERAAVRVAEDQLPSVGVSPALSRPRSSA